MTDTPASETLPRHPWKITFWAFAAYGAFALLLPLIRVPLHRLDLAEGLALVVVPTAIFMLLQLWLSRALVGLRTSLRVSILMIVLSIAIWLILLLLHPHHRIPILEGALWGLLLGLAMTLAYSFFGIALSRIVRDANVLLPVALVAMPIDYIGAMTQIGFTHNVVTSHPAIVQAVSVPVPAVGGLQPIAFIGPGDEVFIGFFLSVVLRLGLNWRGTFWWMYGLLTTAMLLVLFTGFPIAALVPMGLAVLIANGPLLRLKRAEVFAMLYAIGLVLGLVVLFYAYSHSHFFAHPRRAAASQGSRSGNRSGGYHGS